MPIANSTDMVTQNHFPSLDSEVRHEIYNTNPKGTSALHSMVMGPKCNNRAEDQNQ